MDEEQILKEADNIRTERKRQQAFQDAKKILTSLGLCVKGWNFTREQVEELELMAGESIGTLRSGIID